MKKNTVFVVVLALVLVGGYVLFGNKQRANGPEQASRDATSGQTGGQAGSDAAVDAAVAAFLAVSAEEEAVIKDEEANGGVATSDGQVVTDFGQTYDNNDF